VKNVRKLQAAGGIFLTHTVLSVLYLETARHQCLLSKSP